MNSATILTPATTANLGPGFDCLGLTLDLWNKTTFSLEGSGYKIRVRGEGNGLVPLDDRNLILRSFLRLYQAAGVALPEGLSIQSENNIPLGAGLGSSAAAIITGLVGANNLLGKPVTSDELLRMAVAIEGHPDNVASALSGGLTLVTTIYEGVIARHFHATPLVIALAVPAIHLPTTVSRAALPRQVPLSDAVFNLGRVAFVIEALQSGDLILLGKVMDDRLHQPYRLHLIPGGEEAFTAARRAGAAAVALSGAGPSVVAFVPAGDGTSLARKIGEAMVTTFINAGVQARYMVLKISEYGCHQQAE
jgi:homoserine kinase